MFEFDVITVEHDALKAHGLQHAPRVRSRVLVSATEFPDWRVAAQVAGCMAVAIHGGMPVAIMPRV